MAVRVLWVSKGLGPGGAERLLIAAAGAIDHQRFDVSAVYVLPWKDHLAGDLEARGVRTACLSRRRVDPLWPWHLRAAIDGVDVVHSHSPVPAVVARLASLTLPRSRRPALMTTEHNTWSSHRAPTRWANRATSGLDAATLAVTDEAADSLRGPAARRVEVLTHGIDAEWVAGRRAQRDQMRAALSIGADEVVIGTVANYRPQKDYPNLLSAARAMVDAGVEMRIVAVGQGPDETAVTALRNELGLGDQVVLTGFRPDAVDVMAACDAFVLASAWEGLPVAVMEALALGLPIVATEVGGVAESLDDTCAVLVPPRDPRALAAALTTITTDANVRARLSSGARQKAERFDARHAVETITEHYVELAGPRTQTSVTTSPSAPAPTPSRARLPQLPTRAMTDDDLDAVIALLRASLGWGDGDRDRRLFEWKHRTNPFGASPGWVAESDGEVVAVRLFMRWRFRRGTETLRAVRAIDTATHPEFQGRGLFRTLTMEAVDAARRDGVAFVFNTPNAQSRPGYLKMGWRDVGHVPVAFRPLSASALATILRSRVPADRWSLPIDIGVDVATWLDRNGSPEQPSVSSTDRALRTDRDDGFYRWRYGLDDLHYRVVDGGDGPAVIVRLRRRGVARELVVADAFGPRAATDRVAIEVGEAVGATHAIRLGGPGVRNLFMPMPGVGPDLTWRAVNDLGQPPLPNWDLRLGDVELF